jgi:hypothetical protein
MQIFQVKDLHLRYDPDLDEYDDEYDEMPERIANEAHFEDLIPWAMKSMGVTVKGMSIILERGYSDDWEEANCRALKGQKVKFKLNNETYLEDYHVHVIAESASWVIEDDGRVSEDKNNFRVLCVHAEIEEEALTVEEHGLGDCPYLLYYDDIYKKIIKKVDATFYIKVTCADETNDLEDYMAAAIEDSLNNLEEHVYGYVSTSVEDNIDNAGDVEVRLRGSTVTTVKRIPR